MPEIKDVLELIAQGMPALQRGELLPLAARTDTTPTAPQTNTGYRGVIIFLNIIEAGPSGGIGPRLETQDPVSGEWFGLTPYGQTRSAIGKWAYMYHPTQAGASGDVSQSVNMSLPHTWRINMAVGDASEYKYSLGYSYLR